MKHSIKHIFIAASFAASAFMTASAADGNGDPLLRVKSVTVDPRPDRLVVQMDVDARQINPGRDREVIFVPVLRSLTSADTLALPAFAISGRNRYYSHLRNGDLEDGDQLTMAGSKTALHYYQTVAMEPWMTRSRIDVIQRVAHCCDAARPDGENPVAEIDLTPRSAILPMDYVALLGDSAIVRKAEGRAFVNFVVNRTELKPDYMNNPEEIGKILASIKLVQDDPEAIITGVTIKGYASPEGPWDNNVRLAMGRTQTLKEYVRQRYNFDPSIMSSDYEPEDWAGLREWLVENDIPNRDAILQIVDSDLAPDPKNAEIQRRYPEQYRRIHRDVYPWLRHSDYTIKYTFKIHTDVEELKRIYAATPDRLRPVDFQRIAATYPAGSREFDEVMMTAVRIWPNDELANLNAANISMKRDDMTAAARYLAKAGTSPEAMYARGVQAARLGDISTALRLVESARQAGVPQADGAIAILKAEIERPFVTYMITPTGAGE